MTASGDTRHRAAIVESDLEVTMALGVFGSSAVALGAPGIYRAPEVVDHSYVGIRLDVAAFVGIAPRGPVNEYPGARAVESWSAYQELYGGFEGPGRLPYAVAAFFEQGGEKAYVVRVVPYVHARDDGADATAQHRLDGLDFAARSEGEWGSELTLRLSFESSRSFVVSDTDGAWSVLGVAPLRDASVIDAIPLGDRVEVVAGALLRVRCRSRTSPVGALRFVQSIEEIEEPILGGGKRTRRVARLDRPVELAGTTAPGEQTIEIDLITGTLAINHASNGPGLSETLRGLAFDPKHPRWMWSVINEQSSLVRPAESWRHDRFVVTDERLETIASTLLSKGQDRHNLIDVDRDFFDDKYDPLIDEERAKPWRGVHALAGVDEIGLLVVPDLFWEEPAEPVRTSDPKLPCRPTFGPCLVPLPTPLPPPPLGRFLDGSTPESFRTLLARQQRVVEFTEGRNRFVALLDVPDRMPVSRIEQWRNGIDSSYAAAYHPWLRTDRGDDGRDELVAIPPSAVAAGIIAAKERRHTPGSRSGTARTKGIGVAWGPANELAEGVTSLALDVSPETHDRLHIQGVNVFRPDPRGIRLTGARTLSRDLTLRQLSIRRLMLLIRLTLLRESQWMAFEPNNEALRAETAWHVTSFLRQLYLGGAFKGATESEAYFVHCDERLNPRPVLDRGQLFIEVGVAPAEPLEYIVVRLSRSRDDAVSAEEVRV